MMALLRLFLFFELLTTGAFLECETCLATNSSCEGGMERCEEDQDTCAISLSETSEGGEPKLTVAKGCYSSDICASGPIFVTFGKGKFIRSSVICCQREACTSASAHLLPLNTTVNGMRCPGCYSSSTASSTKAVNCTGAENYCLNLMGRTYAGKTVTLKGCTTEPICAGLQSGQWNLHVIEADVTKVDCTPASQAPPPCESALLALSGLLLMKVL